MTTQRTVHLTDIQVNYLKENKISLTEWVRDKMNREMLGVKRERLN